MLQHITAFFEEEKLFIREMRFIVYFGTCVKNVLQRTGFFSTYIYVYVLIKCFPSTVARTDSGHASQRTQGKNCGIII